jgi:hypothetical protein
LSYARFDFSNSLLVYFVMGPFSKSEYAHSITVSTDDGGNLSTSFENSIAGISEEIEKAFH